MNYFLCTDMLWHFIILSSLIVIVSFLLSHFSLNLCIYLLIFTFLFFFNFRDILFLISISSFLSCFESFTFVISNSSTPSLALIFNLHMLSFQFNAIYLFSVYVFKHFNLFYSLLAFFPILFFFIYDFFS